MTPYEAVYGQKPRWGVAPKVPIASLQNIPTGALEEDVEELLSTSPSDNAHTDVLSTDAEEIVTFTVAVKCTANFFQFHDMDLFV